MQLADTGDAEGTAMPRFLNACDELRRQLKFRLASKAATECLRAYTHRLIRMGPDSASEGIDAA
jgi:hypothetical protein